MKHQPDSEGLFNFTLPKSNIGVKCKLLSIGDNRIIDNTLESYPQGMVAPIITKRLESQIVELNGERDKGKISAFITQMPISDSKDVRRFIRDCEPSIDLNRTILAPSGEKVTIDVSFGVEFFRPFFGL
jgi:hypothetical protein